MEEMSLAVAVTLNLGNSICENSGITAHVEIATIKLVTDAANLLSDSAKVISQESISSSYGNFEDDENGVNMVAMLEGFGEGADLSNMLSKNRNRSITTGESMAQESEEDEILSVDTNGIINEGLLVLNAGSDISLPNAEIESGQILAKAIVLGESSIEQVPTAEVLLTTVSPDVKISDGFDLKASEVTPIKMLIGDHVFNGISQSLTDLTGHFFGVYDGHGGSQVANYCRDRIHVALAEEIGRIKNNLCDDTSKENRQAQWEKTFTSCFLKVDDEIGGKVSRAMEMLLVLVLNPLCPKLLDQLRDHKPNREDEYARIEASRGKVIQWKGHRVFGVLVMSRSIGDRYLKPWIIPEPEVMFISRAREDECLILASDGLWDVISNEEACEAAAEYLSMLATQKGSSDNISVIVVDLKAQRKFKSKS
ncbi:hypothetical protein V6N13_138825 [Hibiscus sabdariffa]